MNQAIEIRMELMGILSGSGMAGYIGQLHSDQERIAYLKKLQVFEKEVMSVMDSICEEEVAEQLAGTLAKRSLPLPEEKMRRAVRALFYASVAETFEPGVLANLIKCELPDSKKLAVDWVRKRMLVKTGMMISEAGIPPDFISSLIAPVMTEMINISEE